MMIDRDIFFKEIKGPLFQGSFNQNQVDGINKIIDHWETKWNLNTDLRHLAYMLATVKWETAHTMQPIREYGGITYLKSKKYYPFYGRGLVQLTWEDNYRRMGQLLGVGNFYVENPDKVMEWDHALPIMYEGMFKGQSSKGDFTGKSLEDYFNSKVDDPKGARKIINGTDKDDEIAAIHNLFLSALKKATIVQPTPVTVEQTSFRSVVDLIKAALDKLVQMYEAK